MTKTDFDNSISSLNNKSVANKTKNDSIENKFRKLKTFDSSYFISKSRFEEDDTQNYLVFQPPGKYFKVIANTDYISSWKSKDYLLKPLSHPLTSDSSFTPA